MSNKPNLVASAPGKVLIIGGYLVVESPNVGISIGVNSHFQTEVTRHENVTPEQKASVPIDQKNENIFTVVVNSPQFSKTFTFFITVVVNNDDASKPSLSIFQDPKIDATPNPFLAHSVLYTLGVACGVGSLVDGEEPEKDQTAAQLVVSKLKKVFGENRFLILTLRGANDFYSQQNYLKEKNLPVCAESLRQVPPFAPLIGSVSKTGLGSSAALTSSVVAALFHFARTQVFPRASKLLDVAQEKECIHRIAQSAHCVAQGKIGSGFDVYTACYGTCAYSRFAASRIEPLMAEKSKVVAVEGRSNIVSVTLSTLKNVMGDFHNLEKDPWVNTANAPTCRGLPRNFRLLLADIHAGGTETPGMVSKIFAWKNSLDASDKTNLWNRLAAANIHAIEELQKLTHLQSTNASDYAAAVKVIATSLCGNDDEGWTTASKQSAVLAQFDAVRKAFSECRKLLREVGEKADVEVEPSKLTNLLDATLSNCKGVIAVGCPGAGGYDAVFALALEEEKDNKISSSSTVCDGIEKFWESYNADGLHVCPLLVRESETGSGLRY
jgi:phosphomevalonate kinase